MSEPGNVAELERYIAETKCEFVKGVSTSGGVPALRVDVDVGCTLQQWNSGMWSPVYGLSSVIVAGVGVALTQAECTRAQYALVDMKTCNPEPEDLEGRAEMVALIEEILRCFAHGDIVPKTEGEES